MPPHPLKRTIKAVFNPDRGFILPVVLAVGLIAILLGAMMIERSSQNRITAIAQKANTRSSAAAEYGVAQLQTLLNRYGRLATSSPLSTWADIPNAELDPCGIPPDDIARIQSYANQDWSNVSANPIDGQFRLVSYEYKSDSGTGTLVVESQINPDDAVTRARSKLKVDFDVARAPKVGNAPGLWIQDNQTVGASEAVQLLANVRDSTCPKDIKLSEPIRQLQARIQPAYAYQSVQGIAFPELPSEGSSPSLVPGSGTPAIGAIDGRANSLPSPKQSKSDLDENKDSDNQSGQSQTNSTGATDNGVATYRVQASGGQSINLTNPAAVLRVGTGSDTVVLDLEGGLTITGGGKILLASGSKLIIYARGSVTLAGTETNPAIEQEGSPSATRTQIYVYPPPDSKSSREVSLSGDAVPLYLVLVAPASKVTTSAQVRGSIWAKSWEGTGSAVVKEDPISLSDLNLNWPPRISPITAWQRQENS